MNVSNKDIINNKGLRMIVKLKQRRSNYFIKLRNKSTNEIECDNLTIKINNATNEIDEILTRLENRKG